MASLRWFAVVSVIAGCGSGLRYQAVGAGRVVTAGAPAAVGPGADPNAGLPAAVALPADVPHSTYQVAYEVWLPRATEVEWTLQCGSATQTGVFGETFAAYRERRLVELRAQRAEAQRNAAAVGSLIGDAVIGTTTATATATAPNASAQATATVDGAAIGATIGAATVSTDVELAPGDLGQGSVRGRTTIVVHDDGAASCAMELTPREADVLASGRFTVTRQDDSAERRAAAQFRGAIAVRGSLRSQLLARGGDLTWRERQAVALRAQAAARQEAMAIELAQRNQAQSQAQLAIDLELAAQARARAEAGLAIAMSTQRARVSLVGYLETHGADRGYRGRIAGICQGTRSRLRDSFIASGGDPELRARLALELQLERDREAAELARREALIVDVRGQLTAQLVFRGGAVRTPMPEPIDEQPGEAPMAGYAWSAGHWEWQAGRWQWIYGYWDGTNASAVAGTSVTTVVSGGAAVATTPVVVVTPPAVVTPPVRGSVGVTITIGTPSRRPQHQDHR